MHKHVKNFNILQTKKKVKKIYLLKKGISMKQIMLQFYNKQKKYLCRHTNACRMYIIWRRDVFCWKFWKIVFIIKALHFMGKASMP